MNMDREQIGRSCIHYYCASGIHREPGTVRRYLEADKIQSETIQIRKAYNRLPFVPAQRPEKGKL